MNETGVWVFTLLGIAVGLVVSYWVIRLAVTHAIIAARPEPVKTQGEPS